MKKSLFNKLFLSFFLFFAFLPQTAFAAKTFLVSDSAGSGFASGAGTSYTPLNGNISITATEANRISYFQSAGTTSNFRLYVSANTTTVTITVRTRKNTANGNQTISIASTTTGEFTDGSNSDSYASGDKGSIQIVTYTGGGSISFSKFSLIFDASSNSVQNFFTHTTNTFATNGTLYFGLRSRNAFDSTEANVQWKMRTAGTLQNCRIRFTANSAANSTTVVSRINGSNGNISISIAAAGTGYFTDTSNSDTVASGDLINLAITGTDTGSRTCGQTNLEFITTNSERPLVSTDNAGVAFATGTTNYFTFGDASFASNTTEALTQVTTDIAFSAKNLGAYLSANASTTNGTLYLRVNNASTALTLSLTALTTGWFEDLSHTVDITAGQTYGARLVVGATSGITIRSAGLIMYETAAPSSTVKTLSALGVG